MTTDKIIDTLRALAESLEGDDFEHPLLSLEACLEAADKLEKLANVYRSHQMLQNINMLREEEASGIDIGNDNPDSGPNSRITVWGEWTDYEGRYITGDSLAECLEKAVVMYRKAKETE